MYMYDATTLCQDDHPCFNVSDDQANKKQECHEPRVSAANPNVQCSLDGLGSVSGSDICQYQNRKWNENARQFENLKK